MNIFERIKNIWHILGLCVICAVIGTLLRDCKSDKEPSVTDQNQAAAVAESDKESSVTDQNRAAAVAEKTEISYIDDSSNYVKIMKSTGTLGNQGYVDLGLSVMWATCNLGANNPWEAGDYYAWGETAPKSLFSEVNYTGSDWDMVDNYGNLLKRFDAASRIWQSLWRIPTEAEWTELLNQCDYYGHVMHGQLGINFIGPNGNSIFLPCVGYKSRKSTTEQNLPDYWSSTLVIANNNHILPQCLSWDEEEDDLKLYCFSGCNGLSIRPVCEVR